MNLLAVLITFLLAQLVHGATYYVAQQGGQDGNPGTSAAPFATIQACAARAAQGDTCLIRAGTYRETVTPAQHGVTFAPDGNAQVTVSGADVVTGWTPYQGSIYRAPTGWTLGVEWNQVFVDGQMMILARWPNTSLDVSRPTYATAESSLPNDFIESDYFPWVINDSALTQPAGYWVGAEVTHLAAGMYAQAGTVTASQPGRIEFRSHNGSQSRPMECPCKERYQYALSSVIDALDSAGEWFHNGEALYLWTPTGDDPSGHVVEMKRRFFAFDLRGKQNTVIKDLAIFAASVDMDAQSANNVLDGLTVTYVWHQTRNVPYGIAQQDPKWGGWNTGIRMAGSNNVLKNCEIAYSSHNGVYMRHTKQTVDNCVIHDMAYVPTEGGGVSWMGDDPSAAQPNTKEHVVTRSSIFNTGRHGILLYYATTIQITYNDIHDVCLQTGDCECTYTTKPGSSGTIAYNFCHENHAPYWRFGFGFDQDPENYLVHHNVVWNIPEGMGIALGAPMTNFEVYNNTVWHVGEGYGIKNAGSMTNVKTYNNLVQSGIAGTDTQNNLELSDPGFVDAEGGNFQLRQGSPAIDQGRQIAGITDGFQGSAPDIGAYEFGVPPWRVGAQRLPLRCQPVGAGVLP